MKLYEVLEQCLEGVDSSLPVLLLAGDLHNTINLLRGDCKIEFVNGKITLPSGKVLHTVNANRPITSPISTGIDGGQFAAVIDIGAELDWNTKMYAISRVKGYWYAPEKGVYFKIRKGVGHLEWFVTKISIDNTIIKKDEDET